MLKKIICIFISVLFTGLLFFKDSYASISYEIQASINDEKFIINSEKFEAKTFCFNMEVGDQVIFLEGSPYGACASAELYNKRTERICRVWC